MTYREFLESKIELATDSGFEVDKSRINKALKNHLLQLGGESRRRGTLHQSSLVEYGQVLRAHSLP